MSAAVHPATALEIAVREGIDDCCVGRMVNLTTLAPDMVAAPLDDALPNHITLFDLAVDPRNRRQDNPFLSR